MRHIPHAQTRRPPQQIDDIQFADEQVMPGRNLAAHFVDDFVDAADLTHQLHQNLFPGHRPFAANLDLLNHHCTDPHIFLYEHFPT